MGQSNSGSYAKEKVSGDALGDALIAQGFVANEFALSLNRTIKVPGGFELTAPWSLPSRMFQFPIETHGPEGDRPRTIGLLHPRLAEHPFVLHVENMLGVEIPREPARNACGYTASETARWWHAVDLASAGLWNELRDTAVFTTPGDMFRSTAFAVRCCADKKQPRETVRKARIFMATLECEEPLDRAETIRVALATPMACRTDTGESWPVNDAFRRAVPELLAWAFIFGVEDGWIDFRGGHARWSELGRARFTHAGPIVEADGQSVFAF